MIHVTKKYLRGIVLKTSRLNYILDGVFSIYNDYYCNSSSKYETGLEAATTKCSEDINCAILSSLDCKEDSEYELCEKSTEMLPKLDSCTLWKKGKNIWIEITKLSLYIFRRNQYYLKLCLRFTIFCSTALLWWKEKRRRDSTGLWWKL